MNGMIPAGVDDCHDEIRCARHGHEFHGVKMNRMAGWGKTPRLNTLEGDPVQRGKEVMDLKIRHTWDIIEAAERGLLPDRVMINVHPQRWTDNPVEWTKELVWQNFKNVIKKWMIRTNSFGRDGCLRLDD